MSDNTGDNVVRKQLTAVSNEIAGRINANKSGLQLKFSGLSMKRYSAGYYYHPFHLMKGGGSVGVYLDRYPGGSKYHFWYGLYTESAVRHRAFVAAARSITRGRPLNFSDKDYTMKPYERLKVPLSTFERFLIERYSGDSAYYCGFYSPYTVPLSAGNQDTLVSEATKFLRAYVQRLLELYEPSGKKTKVRPPSSKQSEQAAIQFMSERLENSRPPYKVIDHQAFPWGYDLLAERRKNPSELHIEVKGCVGTLPRFFLSENEDRASREDPRWRLAVVTDVMSKRKRVHSFVTGQGMRSRFALRPIEWEGGQRS
jgi:hypothetical protein